MGRARTIAPEVAAIVETAPVPHAGDAADDPAVWVDPSSPARSVVIGTDKLGGIAVYDLDGRQLQYRPDGKLNNVDLRSGFRLSGKPIVLVAATNRSDDTLALYRLDTRTRQLADVAARPITAARPIYGFCMARRNAAFFAFVTQRGSGVVQQWRLHDNGRERVDARLVRSFDAGNSAEGCVADDGLGVLYVAEEAGGLWRYQLDPPFTRTLVDDTAAGRLHADVEGLAIARRPGGRGLLVVSSQGNSSYVLYRREGGNNYVGTFRIVSRGRIDGVTETDGLEVVTAPLGRRFPHGVLVVQDDVNDGANQNYKLVRWEAVVG